MSNMLLILLLVCGKPTVVVGWGMEAGISPFLGAVDAVLADPELMKAVEFLDSHPLTVNGAIELIPEEEQHLRCGIGA